MSPKSLYPSPRRTRHSFPYVDVSVTRRESHGKRERELLSYHSKETPFRGTKQPGPVSHWHSWIPYPDHCSGLDHSTRSRRELYNRTSIRESRSPLTTPFTFGPRRPPVETGEDPTPFSCLFTLGFYLLLKTTQYKDKGHRLSQD